MRLFLQYFLFVLLIVISFQGLGATSYTSQGYLVELLDDLPEQLDRHFVRELNSSGVIAGQVDGDEGVRVEQAVRWNTDGSIVNLDDNNQEIYSAAYGINDNGDIVGHFDERAATFFNGQISLIRNNNGSVIYGMAVDINNNGTIVGVNGFIVQNNLFGYLNMPVGLSGNPTAINESDQVAGNVFTSSLDRDYRGTLWTNCVSEVLCVPLDAVESMAKDVNDSGVVVGNVNTGDRR